ncbi:SUZ domain-containing protein 1 isoform X2 [Chrysoperla carnea]|uniref:SUZ domain-containing protein 1 isoform X2 n=1 Tax=Chrysoperla carnea TaxID=189513 RepID=UPI001D07B503|nr:SUZ domain-containing protein 1 isoform X2 [Chrysoperla carnea]
MATNKDTEIFESWEDIEDTTVLDRKLNEYLPIKSSNETQLKSGPFNMIIVGEDALRSQYVPPEPTVKILKRPSSNGTQSDKQVTNIKPIQPMKTLRQREQEYAEARLRILGEAKSPEENNCETNSVIVNNRLLTAGVLRPSELEGIIRLPRGPDGTKGFKVRR